MSLTLPREILKWIQGLDLSYSVRDVRRDLHNGFLIAEIYSRYHPYKIQMHSFDNSQKIERKENNWELLEQFHKKNSISYDPLLIPKILNNDFDALYDYMKSMFTNLTSKKIGISPLAKLVKSGKDITVTQSKDIEGTSYVLKEKGLERLSDRKKEEKIDDNNDVKKVNESVSSEAHNLSMSSRKANTFMRVSNKPISSKYEGQDIKLEVKDVNVRQINVSVAKLKEKKEQINTMTHQRTDSNKNVITANELASSNFFSGTEGRNTGAKKEKVIDKTIYDILNEIVILKFQQPSFSEEINKLRVKNNLVIHSFVENIDIFSEDFTSSFFNELLNQTESLVRLAFKDINDFWKYIHFLLTSLKNCGPEKEVYKTIAEVLRLFGFKSYEINPNSFVRIKTIFLDHFLPSIAAQLKLSLFFERKELLINLIFSFLPEDYETVHEGVSRLKSILNDDVIFMQCLYVRISKEGEMRDAGNLFYKDVLHYAKQHLFSRSPSLRMFSLAILNKFTDLDHEVVKGIIDLKLNAIANVTWWECKCQAIIVISKLIRGILESAAFKDLEKQTAQIHKSMTSDVESQMVKIREKIDVYAQAIRDIAFPPESAHIQRITLCSIIDLIPESKVLMELYFNILLISQEDVRQWALYETTQTEDEYLVLSEKSLKYNLSINTKPLENLGQQFLQFVVDVLKDAAVETMTIEYLDLLVFGFLKTDFKKMNMEATENIANQLKSYVVLALCDDELCKGARFVFEKLMDLQFFSEIKIQEIPQLLASAISLIFQNNLEICQEVVKEILSVFYELSTEENPNVLDFMKELQAELMDKYVEVLEIEELKKIFQFN